MTCRCANSRLSAFLDGELSGHEMLQVREHIAHCPECAAEFHAIRELKQFVGAMKAPEPSEGLEARLRARVFAEAAESPVRARVTWRFAFGSFVATAVVASGFFMWLNRGSSGHFNQPVEARLPVSIANDQAYYAAGDPMSPMAPVMSAGYHAR